MAKYDVELIGASIEAIDRGENRQEFKKIVESLGGESARSVICHTIEDLLAGAAELGFVALSQVVNHKQGSRWIVPAANHTPIDQQAVLLKTGADNVAAKAFLQFLKTPEAKTIIRRYGYEIR